MVAQALAGANSTVIYATGSVIGEGLAPTPGLATLPISILVVGMATSTLPAGMIAERYGRRTVFLLGNMFGVLAGLLGALAIVPATISSCSARRPSAAASMRRWF